MPTHISALPEEILLRIFTSFDLSRDWRTLHALRGVSHAFRRVASDPSIFDTIDVSALRDTARQTREFLHFLRVNAGRVRHFLDDGVSESGLAHVRDFCYYLYPCLFLVGFNACCVGYRWCQRTDT